MDGITAGAKRLTLVRRYVKRLNSCLLSCLRIQMAVSHRVEFGQPSFCGDLAAVEGGRCSRSA